MLEFCEQGDLYTYVQSKGKLNENEIKGLSHQLAMGIKYIHTNNIIHRDLKLGKKEYINLIYIIYNEIQFGLVKIIYYKFFLILHFLINFWKLRKFKSVKREIKMY